MAEGIENQKIWDILKLIGCDYAQGYFMSKLIVPNKLMDWIEQRSFAFINKNANLSSSW